MQLAERFVGEQGALRTRFDECELQIADGVQLVPGFQINAQVDQPQELFTQPPRLRAPPTGALSLPPASFGWLTISAFTTLEATSNSGFVSTTPAKSAATR